MKNEDDETVRSIRKTSCRGCRRSRFEGLSPASECCAFGHGQRTILCCCVCKPARRSGSARTCTGTFRDDTPSVPTRPGARSCDTFESLHHRAACRSAEGEELPSEVHPIRASPRATRLGNLPAADRKSRHTANAVPKQPGLFAVRRITAHNQERRERPLRRSRE